MSQREIALLASDQRVGRRPLLAGLAGALGAPILPGLAIAAADPYALGPDFAINWALHKNSKLAKLSQLTTGVKIDTPGTLPDAETDQLALWARRQVSADFRCTFRYKSVVKPLAGGSFSVFYFDVAGEGSATYPVDLAAWGPVSPSDERLYYVHARGLRFSFANFGQAGLNPVNLRPFAFQGQEPRIQPTVANSFRFPLGAEHLVTVLRVGNSLTLTARPAAGGTTIRQEWTNPAIGRWGSGQIGFRTRAQDCVIKGVTVVPA